MKYNLLENNILPEDIVQVTTSELQGVLGKVKALHATGIILQQYSEKELIEKLGAVPYDELFIDLDEIKYIFKIDKSKILNG